VNREGAAGGQGKGEKQGYRQIQTDCLHVRTSWSWDTGIVGKREKSQEGGGQRHAVKGAAACGPPMPLRICLRKTPSLDNLGLGKESHSGGGLKDHSDAHVAPGFSRSVHLPSTSGSSSCKEKRGGDF